MSKKNPQQANPYHFDVINRDGDEVLKDKSILLHRPYMEMENSSEDGEIIHENTLQRDARIFIPGDPLKIAINTSIALGEPLLLTGESGTGKTQSAYYIAHKLGLGSVVHFQVKSDSTAKDLLYHFDTVRYFHDAHLNALETKSSTREPKEFNKSDYIEHRALWTAFKEGKENQAPRVLLIDEIDKAPRDFPNDLLHEINQMEFQILETGEYIQPDKRYKPIVIITSNSERRLPEPFLRRCVYHHIEFDQKLVNKIIESRMHEYRKLDESFLKLAVERFLALREISSLRKKPATGELLMWLRVLAVASGTYPEQLSDKDISSWPFIGTLLKSHQDIKEVNNRQLH